MVALGLGKRQGDHRVPPTRDEQAGDSMITDHRPQPGPDYWEWRCLVCSEPVADHEPFWRWVKRMIRRTLP